MSVNGITGSTTAYQAYTASNIKTTEASATQQSNETSRTAKTGVTSEGVIYEPDTATQKEAVATLKQNAVIIAQLKADSEARTKQLQDLVTQMIGKQSNAFGQATDMWKFLASGNFTVDEATKAQAQADIAEDGYWGVTQTSDRILDFAKALAGDDPDKMNEMAEAFKKGYEQASKTWGGSLPEISQKTYDAVLQKFDTWQTENASA